MKRKKKYEEIEIGMLPNVRWDEIKTIKGKKYYTAIINPACTEAKIFLDKKKVDAGKIRIRNNIKGGDTHSMYETINRTVKVKKK